MLIDIVKSVRWEIRLTQKFEFLPKKGLGALNQKSFLVISYKSKIYPCYDP